MTASEQTTSELGQLREQHEAARLKLEIRQLRSAAGLPLVEEWGDVVDRRETRFDDSGGGSRWRTAPATLDDRSDGRFRPIYETEQDLAAIRGAARQLASRTAVAIGALDALANYVLGGGFTFTVHSEFEQPQLVTAAQKVIDEFLDQNDFAGGLDRELHQRSREDGEAFLALVPRSDGSIHTQVLEPEQIVQPADPSPIEEWLGIGGEWESSWSFGIHTPSDACDSPLGYHVVFDSSGIGWDYFPVEMLQHIKRNVPRNAKRGVSDFHAIQGDLEREAALRRNTAEGAALQAAVAWILQMPPGTTPAQAHSLGGRDLATGQTRPAQPGLTTNNVSHYPPGTVLRPSAGLEYKPGPMGSERNANFVLVAQYVLRSIGVRWNMPEYLISGDASNANYASTLVAESPFVKAREADQQFYRRHWHELIWKVLFLAWRAGRFARLHVSWPKLHELIDIKVDAPSVATRDPLQLARTQESQVRLGILSRATAAAQAGLDYDVELRQGAVASPAQPPPDTGAADSAG
ncbi:MAG: phage portal protein [Planctomycetaceae bacterium]|nr:phage portal protein [Planctomycetaceae bacterium]